ncbi:MAG: NAD(P)/FAD-dependent oxidoreductase [Candidatus Altiarchaeota archaeon]
MNDSYDVVIIGSGPAGATTAIYAAKNANVLLLDKHTEIGSPKRCGEGVGVRLFNELNIPKDRRFINKEIYGFIAYAPDKTKIKLRYDEISGYIIERKIFDKFLASEAARAGADVFADTKASLWKENGKIVGVNAIQFGEEIKIRAKIVVAADGVDSVIAREAGINSTLAQVHLDSCMEYEMANIAIDEPDLIHIYLGNEVAPRGYCWVFPKDNDRANVGIGISGTSKEKNAKFYLDKFINENEGLRNGSILEVNVGAVPVGGLLKELVRDNLLVVGDAARQVNPIHGGGIYEAMSAGRIAGEKITKAIAENDIKILKEYERDWWASHGERLSKVLKIRNFAEKLSDEDMNYLAKVWNGEDLAQLSRGAYVEVFKKALKHPKLLTLVKNFL